MIRPKLALLVLSTLPTVMFLSHFSGYSSQSHWKETIRDGLVVFMVGLLFSPVPLFLFGQLNREMPFEEIFGKIMSGEEKPDWFMESDWEQMRLIRDQWI